MTHRSREDSFSVSPQLLVRMLLLATKLRPRAVLLPSLFAAGDPDGRVLREGVGVPVAGGLQPAPQSALLLLLLLPAPQAQAVKGREKVFARNCGGLERWLRLSHFGGGHDAGLQREVVCVLETDGCGGGGGGGGRRAEAARRSCC